MVNARTRKLMVVAVLSALGLTALALRAGALVTPGEVPVRTIDLPGTDMNVSTPGAREVLELGWGSGSADAGRSGGSEADLVGPSSFTVDPSGTVYLLDQVNKRISAFSSTGKKLKDIELPTDTTQELRRGANGDLYALDAARDPKVYRLSAEGELKATLPLSVRKGMSARYQAISGLFVADRKVSVEFGHEQSVALTDETGKQRSLPQQESEAFRGGRMIQGDDGRRIFAEEVTRDRVAMLVTAANGDPLYRVQIKSLRPIDSILDVQSDRAGNTYVLLHLMRPASSSSANDGADALTLVSFDPEGDYRGRLDMPYEYLTTRFREVEVTETGAVYQLRTTRAGIKIVMWPNVEN